MYAVQTTITAVDATARPGLWTLSNRNTKSTTAFASTTTRSTASQRNIRSSTVMAGANQLVSARRTPAGTALRPGEGLIERLGQDAFACPRSSSSISRASAAAFSSRSRRLPSSLARPAYWSTYSWPESRMISYMISSVIERRM